MTDANGVEDDRGVGGSSSKGHNMKEEPPDLSAPSFSAPHPNISIETLALQTLSKPVKSTAELHICFARKPRVS